MPPDSSDLSAQQIAARSAALMLANDPASTRLGMELEDIRPGHARLRMTVRDFMLNGHRTCHGGYLFTLADSAFAFACNSYNRVTVAAGATIDFLSPARLGEVLTATASERALGNRTGVYDVLVSAQDGRQIALFRGRSHRTKGLLFEPTGNGRTT